MLATSEEPPIVNAAEGGGDAPTGDAPSPTTATATTEKTTLNTTEADATILSGPEIIVDEGTGYHAPISVFGDSEEEVNTIEPSSASIPPPPPPPQEQQEGEEENANEERVSEGRTCRGPDGGSVTRVDADGQEEEEAETPTDMKANEEEHEENINTQAINRDGEDSLLPVVASARADVTPFPPSPPPILPPTIEEECNEVAGEVQTAAATTTVPVVEEDAPAAVEEVDAAAPPSPPPSPPPPAIDAAQRYRLRVLDFFSRYDPSKSFSDAAIAALVGPSGPPERAFFKRLHQQYGLSAPQQPPPGTTNEETTTRQHHADPNHRHHEPHVLGRLGQSLRRHSEDEMPAGNGGPQSHSQHTTQAERQLSLDGIDEEVVSVGGSSLLAETGGGGGGGVGINLNGLDACSPPRHVLSPPPTGNKGQLFLSANVAATQQHGGGGGGDRLSTTSPTTGGAAGATGEWDPLWDAAAEPFFPSGDFQPQSWNSHSGTATNPAKARFRLVEEQNGVRQVQRIIYAGAPTFLDHRRPRMVPDTRVAPLVEALNPLAWTAVGGGGSGAGSAAATAAAEAEVQRRQRALLQRTLRRLGRRAGADDRHLLTGAIGPSCAVDAPMWVSDEQFVFGAGSERVPLSPFTRRPSRQGTLLSSGVFPGSGSAATVSMTDHHPSRVSTTSDGGKASVGVASSSLGGAGSAGAGIGACLVSAISPLSSRHDVSDDELSLSSYSDRSIPSPVELTPDNYLPAS